MTPARTAPHCQSREQGEITAPQLESRVQCNSGVHDEQESSYVVRVGVWVDQAGEWRLAGTQFSPLAEG